MCYLYIVTVYCTLSCISGYCTYSLNCSTINSFLYMTLNSILCFDHFLEPKVIHQCLVYQSIYFTVHNDFIVYFTCTLEMISCVYFFHVFQLIFSELLMSHFVWKCHIYIYIYMWSCCSIYNAGVIHFANRHVTYSQCSDMPEVHLLR